MNIYFDTEFTQLHKDASLISIGLIDENGRSFYAEFNDYNRSQINEWLKTNVIDNLYHNDVETYFETSADSFEIKGSSLYVSRLLNLWLELNSNDNIQFVSDVCHYDFVLLIDLLLKCRLVDKSEHIYTALDLPSYICPACVELNNIIADKFNISIKEAFDFNREGFLNKVGMDADGKTHNSLYDAKVIRNIYDELITHPSLASMQMMLSYNTKSKKENK